MKRSACHSFFLCPRFAKIDRIVYFWRLKILLIRIMESIAIYLPIILAVVGLLYMFVKKAWVMKQDAGDGKMKEISDHIYEGALAFLKAEYRLTYVFRYRSKFGTCWCSIYCAYYTLPHNCCFYCWCHFLSARWKYGNEE